MAGVLGIEPRSSVLETDILTAVLYPYSIRITIPIPLPNVNHTRILISRVLRLSAILVSMKSLSLTVPRVIAVIGVPGAGKSYFASRFSETFHTPYLEADKLRSALASQPSYDSAEQEAVDQLMMLQMNELFKTKQTFLIEGGTEAKVDRANFAKLAHTHGYEPLFVWVQTDPDTAYLRATRPSRANRDKLLLVPDARYQQLLKRFTLPSEAEKAVVISGKHTYATQAKAVLKRLAEPNRPSRTPLQVPTRQLIKGTSIKIS